MASHDCHHHRLLTRPIERLAQRIRYGKWAQHKAITDPQPTPVQPKHQDKSKKQLIPCPHGFNNYMNCKICKDYNCDKGAEDQSLNDKELVKRLSKILQNARAEQYTQRLRFERMQNEITEIIEILLTGEQQTITALATN